MVNMSTDTIKLLPCPFCGGEAMAIENNFYTDIHSVMCRNCFAESDRYHTQKEAIKQWNTRKLMQEILEKLQDELELSGKEKVRTIDNPYQFRRVQGYSDGIAVAIDFVREVGGMNESR